MILRICSPSSRSAAKLWSPSSQKSYTRAGFGTEVSISGGTQLSSPVTVTSTPRGIPEAGV